MRIDISFLPALAAAFILCFGRVGAMVMLLPGIGESNLPARVRLAIALALTAVLLPLHRQAYAIDMTQLSALMLAMMQEVVIGLVLGITARLAVSALQTAGFIVASRSAWASSPRSTRRRTSRACWSAISSRCSA